MTETEGIVEYSPEFIEDPDSFKESIQREFEDGESTKREPITVFGIRVGTKEVTEKKVSYFVPNSSIHSAVQTVLDPSNSIQRDLEEVGEELASIITEATDEYVEEILEGEYGHLTVDYGKSTNVSANEQDAAYVMVGSALNFIKERSGKMKARIDAEAIRWYIGDNDWPELPQMSAQEGNCLTDKQMERLRAVAEDVEKTGKMGAHEIGGLRYVADRTDREINEYHIIREIQGALDPDVDQSYDHLAEGAGEHLEQVETPAESIEKLSSGIKSELHRLEDEREIRTIIGYR